MSLGCRTALPAGTTQTTPVKPPTTPAAEQTQADEPSISSLPSSPSSNGREPSELPNDGPSVADATWSDLPLEGFEPALLWYRRQAPLLVVTHGAGGFAEWHCQHFHRIFSGTVTLLCPRGKRRVTRDPSQGYYYPDHLALRREIHAAVERFEAVTAHEGAGRPYAYAGYSQGATMGALALAEEGDLFSRLLLVEGGYADWYEALVHRFKNSGGQAIALICGTKSCHEHARAAAPRFQHAGLEFRTATAHAAGHRPDGEVEKHTILALPFLFSTDPRWAAALSKLDH